MRLARKRDEERLYPALQLQTSMLLDGVAHQMVLDAEAGLLFCIVDRQTGSGPRPKPCVGDLHIYDVKALLARAK